MEQTFFLPEVQESDFLPYDILHPTRKRDSASLSTSKALQIGTWTPEEDNLLCSLIKETPHKKQWQTMSAHFDGKTAQQIMNRWNKVLNPELVKGNWSQEEDDILTNWVNEKGESGWTKVAQLLPGRIGKQCRERWMNCLKPDIKKCGWTEEEDNTIIHLQLTMGNKWAKMADILKGRTDNQIKNRWNSVLKKKQQMSATLNLQQQMNFLMVPQMPAPPLTPTASLTPQIPPSMISSNATISLPDFSFSSLGNGDDQIYSDDMCNFGNNFLDDGQMNDDIFGSNEQQDDMFGDIWEDSCWMDNKSR